MLFLEYDVDDAPYSRYSRFWAAHGGGSVILPIIDVDSGNQISSGYLDFVPVYRQMIETARPRTVQADVQATWQRVEDRVVVQATVTNRSGVPLAAYNSATVHAVVYEETRVKLTGRFVRDAQSVAIDALDDGTTATYVLESEELAEVNWEKMAVVVIVDYRPSSGSNIYDTLQAGLATRIEQPLEIATQQVTFLVDPANPARTVPAPQVVAIQGAAGMTWRAEASAPWLSVAPITGTVGTTSTLTVDPGSLADGWQQGTVTYIAANDRYSDTVTVDAYRGTVYGVALPSLGK